MYFIELLLKKLGKIKQKNKNGYTVLSEENRDENDCPGHIYLPIDSSGEHLACKNCGHIIKKGALPPY